MSTVSFAVAIFCTLMVFVNIKYKEESTSAAGNALLAAFNFGIGFYLFRQGY